MSFTRFSKTKRTTMPREGFKISDSRSSENRLAWAGTHDSSHHSGTDALAQATFSRPSEIRPVSTPFLSLKRVPLRSGENPRKCLRVTLNPSLGRADSRSSENHPIAPRLPNIHTTQELKILGCYC
ncbi:hypothetical protein Lal_00005786 [Lupinus albus]|nr:hypothetical protein Lal_00005786 [Lupinus albus]